EKHPAEVSEAGPTLPREDRQRKEHRHGREVLRDADPETDAKLGGAELAAIEEDLDHQGRARVRDHEPEKDGLAPVVDEEDAREHHHDGADEHLPDAETCSPHELSYSIRREVEPDREHE